MGKGYVLHATSRIGSSDSLDVLSSTTTTSAPQPALWRRLTSALASLMLLVALAFELAVVALLLDTLLRRDTAARLIFPAIDPLHIGNLLRARLAVWTAAPVATLAGAVVSALNVPMTVLGLVAKFSSKISTFQLFIGWRIVYTLLVVGADALVVTGRLPAVRLLADANLDRVALMWVDGITLAILILLFTHRFPPAKRAASGAKPSTLRPNPRPADGILRASWELAQRLLQSRRTSTTGAAGEPASSSDRYAGVIVQVYEYETDTPPVPLLPPPPPHARTVPRPAKPQAHPAAAVPRRRNSGTDIPLALAPAPISGPPPHAQRAASPAPVAAPGFAYPGLLLEQPRLAHHSGGSGDSFYSAHRPASDSTAMRRYPPAPPLRRITVEDAALFPYRGSPSLGPTAQRARAAAVLEGRAGRGRQ
ncbi:hypothetical protein H9P43_008432 [Blastocladiella emersonii ATCC 22665]|nr:hypothetical protein H9P43_008432 [Blastocladiella emersonii ATCC 22665]